MNTTGLPKLSFPKIQNIYTRQRLNEYLDSCVNNPATWVQGPAGSGKTTLIASYLNDSDKQLLWYQIDQGDKDPASFFHYLSLLIKHLTPGSKITMPVLTPEYMGSLDLFTRNYFRAINLRLKKPYVLVLDNFQDMDDKANLQGALAQAIEEMSEHSHIFFISRVYPSEVFSRLQINQQINLIDWNTLKLTYEEYLEYTDYLSETESVQLTTEQYDVIWKNTNGWITGIMLQIKSATNDETSSFAMDVNATQLLFNYFAAELFDQQALSIREFLMKTAFLPVIYIDMAIDLTGDVSAREILHNSHKQHFFTDCLSVESNTYQYHQLFREFLLMKAKSYWDDESILDIYKSTAVILEKNDYEKEAINAYLNAKIWDEATRLICKNSSTLLDNGFYTLVTDWVDEIPGDLVENSPWLQYWKAISILTCNPHDARLLLENSYEQFKKINNPDGISLTWSGLIETYMFLRDNYSPLERLVEDIDYLYKKYDGFTNNKMKLSIIGSGLMVILFFKPDHHLLPVWANEIKEVVLGDTNLGDRIKLASYLMHYYSWIGDVNSMEVIFDYINPSIKKSQLSPLSEIIWSWAVSLYGWITYNNDIGKQAVDNGISLALDNGIHIWDFALYTQSTYLALFNLDKYIITESLSDMINHLRQDYALDTGHYHYLAAWSCYKDQDYIKAEEHINIAIAMTTKAATPYPVHLSKFAKSIIAINNKNYQEAKDLLDNAYDFSISMNSKILLYKSLLGKAWLYSKIGDPDNTLTCLNQALLIAKENKYSNFDWISQDYITDLSIMALKNDIETEYVYGLIAKLNIKPDPRAIYLEKWPWPVKIYTLGEFSVLVDNKQIEVKNKGNKKPMDLLKATIALGITNVNAESIQEIIWPDTDGDKAQQNFNVTLHRLRKILNSNQSIILANGKLSINRDVVWLDMAGFLETTSSKTLIDDDSADNMYNILGYYNGDFLADESNDYWILTIREKLRNRFLSQITRLGNYFLNNCSYEKAVDVYNMGIEIDICIEEFYYGLIKAYIAQNRESEAVLVYQRCSRALNNIFGLKPSIDIQSLLSHINK